MHNRKLSPRAEYRLQQSQLVAESANIAQKFPALKSLIVDLEYFDPTGQVRNGGMKFKPNLENAKSLFRFNCVNGECAGGDYDLTEELAAAIKAREKTVTGEMRCQGIRHNRERKDQTPCRGILRYKLTLGYGSAPKKKAAKKPRPARLAVAR